MIYINYINSIGEITEKIIFQQSLGFVLFQLKHRYWQLRVEGTQFILSTVFQANTPTKIFQTGNILVANRI